MQIEGYHGTTEECAKQIESSNFKLPQKPTVDCSDDKKKTYYEYWLGPGVYMFRDKRAAQWWSTHPCRTYGSVGIPAVMECSIELTSKSVDLTLVEGIELLHKEYENFIKMIRNAKGKITIKSNKYKDMNAQAVLRSSFFRWFQQRNGIDVLIANFIPENMPYVPDEYRRSILDLGLVYNETQYCIYDVRVIKSKAVL